MMLAVGEFDPEQMILKLDLTMQDRLLIILAKSKDPDFNSLYGQVYLASTETEPLGDITLIEANDPLALLA